MASSFNESKNESNIIKKYYEIEKDDNKYNLIINLYNRYIEFEVYQLNDIKLTYFKNKFTLENINNILDLNYDIFNNLKQFLELIDSAYKNKKLLINYDNINNEMNIIIGYTIEFKNKIKQYKRLIPLIKADLDINKRFENIFNEIILLKKSKDLNNDKLKKIEKLLLEIKSNVNKKLEENLNVINSLKKEIERNKIFMKNNKEDIILLKNEILILKYPEIKELNKKYNLNIKDINIEKLDLSLKGIENDDIKYLRIFKELKELYLSYNNISDISVLEKVKFEQLEILDLRWNEI